MKTMLIIAIIMTVPLRAALADPLPAAETGTGKQMSEVIAESGKTDPMVLEPIVVEGEREPEPDPQKKISEAFIVPKDKEPNTERTVPREGIRMLATPGQTNPFLAIQMLPSVNVQMTDPYGLSSQFSINIRGKTAFHLGRTVEDLPLNGVAGGIQGGFDLFDLENIKGVTLYSGAVPLDHSFNPSNATGNLNLSILRPNDKFGVTYRQSNGSFDFNRTFGRIDTGLLPTKTKFYASYSYSYAHKWKGEGDSPTGRLNGEFGMVQELTQYAKLEVFGVVQDYRANTFQSLTYAQTGNLNAFRSLDFNPGITGKPNQDQLFYNFNTQAFYNYTLFANLEVKPTSTSRFMLKPYYWDDNGYTLTGVGGPFTGKQAVTRIDQNNYNWGVVAQYDAELFWGINGSLGYWHQTMQPPPPPTGQKAFFPLANGQLQFAGWSLLGKQSNYSFDTPYLIFKKQVGRFDGVMGLKYFYQQSPSFQGFQTAGLPDVPYSQVFNFNPKADSAMSVNATSFHQFLPYAGGTYAFTERLTGRFIYGRNYGQANTGPTIQTFAMNEAAFKKVGLNLNDIVSPLQPEITDNFDLGLRYNDRKWFVAPTLFFTRVRNQEVFAFDPNVGVSYAVSTAKARNYGGELEVGAEPIDHLTVFGTASYFIYEFEDNVVSATKTQLNLTGNQVPDAPKWMAKLGATYDRYGFSASPVVQWLGSRWGDALNTQRVSDYYVVNGYLGYKVPERYSFGLKNLRLTGTFLNIFDRKYVSVISFNEFNLTGQTSYFAGPPFTAVVGLTASTF